MKSIALIPPKIVGYWLFRRLNYPKLLPINLTVSVTNRCNSRCKTCNIWKLYMVNPSLQEKELKLKEFEKIFESMGTAPYVITISGGEPYLRQDLSDICIRACEYCHPKILVIPTNATLPNEVKEKTQKILKKITDTEVIVNISIDGIGYQHDEIRGIRGNYDLVLRTYNELKKLKNRYPNLTIGMHTVISRWNVEDFPAICEYIINVLKPDTYITEIAEHREELFNLEDEIVPSPQQYEKAIKHLITNMVASYSKRLRLLQRVQLSFRIEYYNMVIQLINGKNGFKCYAGMASAHINPYGDVWPCCILAYKCPMGNLRDVDYDFKKIWRSEKANRIRNMIKQSACHCPMANANYTNMLANPRILFKVLFRILKWAIT